MWTNSTPGHYPLLFLANDARPAGYSKHRQEGSDMHGKQIDWRSLILRLCKYGSAGAKNKATFQGKTRVLLCNKGKHLQTVDGATSSGKEKNLKAA